LIPAFIIVENKGIYQNVEKMGPENFPTKAASKFYGDLRKVAHTL